MDNIWNDLDTLMNEMYIEEEHVCKHSKTIVENLFTVCTECGTVLDEKIYEMNEWNCYKNEQGGYKESCQRADDKISDNPYDTPTIIPGINKNSLMMRIHYSETFSHKQKTFWKTSEKLENYCGLLKLNNTILFTSKRMWHIYMESGKLTRGSVRLGLISACLYYACIFNNCPIDRHDIVDITEGNQKGFLKGEKIFLEIMETVQLYCHLGKETINIKENDTFVKFCTDLNLPFITYEKCNKIYSQYIEKLDSVSPKSITAGILFYVVKYILDLKQPSKSKISQTVNVCIPTINKVISLILEN